MNRKGKVDGAKRTKFLGYRAESVSRFDSICVRVFFSGFKETQPLPHMNVSKFVLSTLAVISFRSHSREAVSHT